MKVGASTVDKSKNSASSDTLNFLKNNVYNDELIEETAMQRLNSKATLSLSDVFDEDDIDFDQLMIAIGPRDKSKAYKLAAEHLETFYSDRQNDKQ